MAWRVRKVRSEAQAPSTAPSSQRQLYIHHDLREATQKPTYPLRQTEAFRSSAHGAHKFALLQTPCRSRHEPPAIRRLGETTGQ